MTVESNLVGSTRPCNIRLEVPACVSVGIERIADIITTKSIHKKLITQITNMAFDLPWFFLSNDLDNVNSPIVDYIKIFIY